MSSFFFLTLGKRRGERDKENRNKIRENNVLPFLAFVRGEWKFFLEGEGQGRQLRHTGVQVQETRGPQTSHDGGAWPHVPCIDLLAFPHIKNDQIETRQAHPGDSASKPLPFAPRSADEGSKLVRAATWTLWPGSMDGAFELAAVVPFELGCSHIAPPHKTELNPWERALSFHQIVRTFTDCKDLCVSAKYPSQTTYSSLGHHCYHQHYTYQPHKTVQSHWGQSPGPSDARSIAAPKLSQRSFPWDLQKHR